MCSNLLADRYLAWQIWTIKQLYMLEAHLSYIVKELLLIFICKISFSGKLAMMNRTVCRLACLQMMDIFMRQVLDETNYALVGMLTDDVVWDF